MKTFFSIFAYSLLLIFATSLSGVAQDKDWRPISPDDLAAKAPIVEPDADAEAIFWETRIDDSKPTELAMDHYVRIKIFSSAGVERFRRKEIAFTKGTHVKNIAARVTQPDGSVSFAVSDDITERIVLRKNGRKIKVRSLAIKNLQIGSIVEYKYREVIENGYAKMRLIFQRDIPIREMSYLIRPYKGNLNFLFKAFNMLANFVKGPDGFFRARLTNVPAFIDEPYMPPRDEVRRWVYVYYSSEKTIDPEKYWLASTKFLRDGATILMKIDDKIRNKAVELTRTATSDEEKVRRIYDFCRSEIKNITYEVAASEKEKDAVDRSRFPGKVLESKIGSSADIDFLYGTLLRAAGFDARSILVGDRSEKFFDFNTPDLDLIMDGSVMAVHYDNHWVVNSPGTKYATYGMLNWWVEGQTGLVEDPAKLIWINLPLSGPERSTVKNIGKFRLHPDGTLEGEVEIEFDGHLGSQRKAINDVASVSEREKIVRDELAKRLRTVDASNIRVENATDAEKPFRYLYKVAVPDYAIKKGDTLLLQPGFFQFGSISMFPEINRKFDVYFDYPWSESDEVDIQIPEGFEPAEMKEPGLVTDPAGIGKLTTNVTFDRTRSLLSYRRSFYFGKNGRILFPARVYPQIKNIFDAFHKTNTQTVLIRRK